MNVIFQAHPACKTDIGFMVSYSLVNDHPRRDVVAANIKEVRELFEGWKAEMEATGKPYRVSLMQHPRDRSRKFPGFNKIEDHMTAAAMTATEADLEGVK
jgi:hypothetical protein